MERVYLEKQYRPELHKSVFVKNPDCVFENYRIKFNPKYITKSRDSFQIKIKIW